MFQMNENELLTQYCSALTIFTSQYGAENSITYAAKNVIGQYSIYPSYGDFTQACVLRTYGNWWRHYTHHYQICNLSKFDCIEADDFLEVKFDIKTYIEKISIYETYNPGAVVAIYAGDTGPNEDRKVIHWVKLWSGVPQKVEAQARIFSPPIKKVGFSSDVLRICFNSRHLEYYTEIDAVSVSGRLMYSREAVTRDNATIDDTISKMDSLCIANNCYLLEMSEEIISSSLLIHLDLISLCELARTCRKMRKLVYDKFLYQSVSLKNYWPLVTDDTLQGLSSRFELLSKLDLSWCGSQGHIKSNVAIEFFEKCGRNLKVLHMNTCPFVDKHVLCTIAQTCLKLIDISLEGNIQLESHAFHWINHLVHLRRLNLCRTRVDIHSTISIIRSCHSLERINMDSCVNINDYDCVIVELSIHCRNLKSLSLWRAKTLSGEGLDMLSSFCVALEELDVGWCSGVRASTGCILRLCERCTSLKKLILTANRTISDEDIRSVFKYLKHLEQLDILGTSDVQISSITELLNRCTDLKFLDLSFCRFVGLDKEIGPIIAHWQKNYPKVSIKRSFQLSNN